MTHSHAPAMSRPIRLRRRSAAVTGAVLGAVLAVAALAGCSGGADASGGQPTPGPNAKITVAAQVPAPPKPCAVSAMLVSSCRPWLGAAANGNPAVPHSAIPQFTYLERLLGHHLDIFRDYNSPTAGGPYGQLPLNSDELYFAKQPGTYVDVNWKPAIHWAQADGGDAAVNAEIKKAADNIKAVAPHKIFLTIGVEPQRGVSGGTNCQGLVGGSGTPAQYKLMWQNVERIFAAQGTDNVVWAMDYMSDPQFTCLVPQLWPGNSLVDWVFYDSYDRGHGSTWSGTVGAFYQVLEHDSSPSVNFDSKPWGLGEFGTCKNSSAANAEQYFVQARQAIEANAYPRLKLYNVYADTGNNAGLGCLTDYDVNGQQDAAKNAAAASLFNSPVFNR